MTTSDSNSGSDSSNGQGGNQNNQSQSGKKKSSSDKTQKPIISNPVVITTRSERASEKQTKNLDLINPEKTSK